MKRIAIVGILLLSSCSPNLTNVVNDVLDGTRISIPSTAPNPGPAPTPPKTTTNVSFSSTFYYGDKQILIAQGNGKDIGFNYGSGMRATSKSVSFKEKNGRLTVFTYPDKITLRVSYDDFQYTEWKTYDTTTKLESPWQKLN